MVVVRPVIAAALLAGCVPERAAEDPDWYSAAGDLDVREPVAFTDQPYDFPAQGAGIGDLPMPPDFTTWFAPDDPPPAGCGDWTEDGALPVEIEGMVTVHPRMYFKVDGCVPADNRAVDSDEKYYGSFFVEDATGGVFVLGDSKVAHFDMGDRVALKVRALKNNFGLKMVAAHDVLSVDRGPYPIHYEVADAPFTDADVGEVRRITGVVVQEPDTFGELWLEGDEGQQWAVSLDIELSRRGLTYPLGARLEVTGPVLFSFSTYSVVVMKKGQVAVLSD